MLQRRAGPGRDQRVAELVADQGLTVAGARRLDGPERPSIRSSSAPITPTLSGTRYGTADLRAARPDGQRSWAEPG